MSPSSITEVHRRERLTQAGAVLLYGIFGLLLFGPMASGGVEPRSIFLLEAGSAALFLLWIGKQVLDGAILDSAIVGGPIIVGPIVDRPIVDRPIVDRPIK